MEPIRFFLRGFLSPPELLTLTAHYAVTDAAGPISFSRRNNRIEGAAREGDRILHLVNMAPGRREVFRVGRRSYVNLSKLPTVPRSRVRIRMPSRPRSVTLQPQDIAVKDWHYANGYVEADVPEFEVHQMIVVTKE